MAVKHAAWTMLLVVALVLPAPALTQESAVVTERNDSVSIRIVDADLRAALQAIGRHLDRPVIFGALHPGRVTLETPRPVARPDLIHLLRSLLDSQNLDLITDETGHRVLPRGGGRPDAGWASGSALPTGAMELFVIRLRHARAPDVAAVVNTLYGRPDALGELGGPPPTLPQHLRDQRIPPSGVPNPLEEAVVPGRVAWLAGEIVIVPDTRTNSLLVRAEPGDFELIRAAVEQIDIRPLQVLIEVLIAEVRRDRSFALGVGADIPPTRIPGTTNTTIEGSTAGLGAGDFALRVLNLGGINWDATLHAAAARGDVTILSRPVLIAANNERASILVGSQRPFVQVQRTLPTDAATRDQVIQYRDVGTQLNVRPTISTDGYVMLEVMQEVNAATTETAFDAPVISTRSVITQLLVRDGQTAVLGGLTDHQRDATRGGVPVLSRLPLVGWLFGRTARRTTETELFLFLTPRVIRSDHDLEETSRGIQDNARQIRRPIQALPPLLPPIRVDTVPHDPIQRP